MTQNQQIELLNSIMPEINASANPEGTMLKCASEHNLAPAQLEKLAQVYNTGKTLQGYKQASFRGESHDLVDVPSLVTQYTTYDPSKKITGESRGIHRNVNKLVKFAKDADGWDSIFDTTPLHKAASLPNLTLYPDELLEEDVVEKSARFKQQDAVRLAQQERGHTYHATEDIQQIMYETQAEIAEKCAALRVQLTPDEGRWAEAVEDIVTAYGEKSAAVIERIETYFINDRFHFTPADLEKQAFKRAIAQDRHNTFDTVEEILELQALYKQASDIAGVMDDDTDTSKKKRRPVDKNFMVFSDDEIAANNAQNTTEQDRLQGIEHHDDSMWEALYQQAGGDKTWGSMDAYRAKRRAVHANSARMEARAEDPEVVSKSWEYSKTDAGPKADSEKSTTPTPEGEIAAGGSGKPPSPGDDAEGVMDDPNYVVNPGSIGSDIGAAAGVIPELAKENLDALMDGMKNPFYRMNTPINAPLKTLDNLVKQVAPTRNSRQEHIDTAMGRTQTEGTLQRLMLEDPTIAEADPNTVNDIFRTIADLSPSFAKDPIKMAPVMKEALQYDSVPLHILKELAAYEGQVIKNDTMRGALDDSNYKIGGGFKL